MGDLICSKKFHNQEDVKEMVQKIGYEVSPKLTLVNKWT